jgi:transmembrane sensor
MDAEQLARYLAGEASTTEQAQVEAWAAADPDHRAELERLEVAWTAEPVGSWDVDRAWNRVASRLGQAAVDPADFDVTPIRRSLPVRWLAAAAVLLVTAGGVWLSRKDTAVDYATAVGEQKSVSLPDGSQVTLAPSSALKVAAGFGRSNRSLSLNGRAWFVVRHDAAVAFKVSAGGATIEDLGTEFEVNATEPAIRVAVAAGSVTVSRPGAPAMTLGAGDLATLEPQGAPTVNHATAVDRMASWRQGKLFFDNRPLVEVAAELQRWYDVSITLSGEVGARHFTGDVPTGQLDEALTLLATAVPGVVQSRQGRVITFAPRGAP